MQKVKRKGLELVDKLIRKQSGVDSQIEQGECTSWFYQPKRPEKIIKKNGN